MMLSPEFPVVQRVTSLSLRGVRGVPFRPDRAKALVTLNTDADIVVISAPNGHGKSTVIEALLFLLTGACAPGRGLADLVHHRSGSNAAGLEISANCKTISDAVRILRVGVPGPDGRPRFDEGQDEQPAARPRCIDRRLHEVVRHDAGKNGEELLIREEAQLAATMRRACLYSPDSPTASTDETALSQGGRSFADLFRRRNVLRAVATGDSGTVDANKARLEDAQRNLESLQIEAAALLAERDALRSTAESAVDALVTLVESVLVAARQRPPQWATKGLSRLPEVATALGVGVVVGESSVRRLLDQITTSLDDRINGLRSLEAQRQLEDYYAKRVDLKAKLQAIVSVSVEWARELDTLGRLFIATAEAPECYLKAVRAAVAAGNVDKRVLDELTRIDVALARQLGEGLGAVFADAAGAEAKRAELSARIEELNRVIAPLEAQGERERETLKGRLQLFKGVGVHRKALLDYARARAAELGTFKDDVADYKRRLDATIAFLDAWLKVAQQIPAPVAGAYRKYMGKFMARFRVAGGSEVTASAQANSSQVGESFRHELSRGRTLGRMSSGQASQVAVASMLAQNHILGAFHDETHGIGLSHRLLFLDDVSTTYDRGNLLRETLLWRQLAYGPDALADRRQLFITSHLDDLNRQLVDMLAPPPGRSLIVYLIRKWDPETGPAFEGYRIGSTAKSEDVQRGILKRLPDIRRISEQRSA
jgi:ABC-type Mn2+/Zn2+ transport system ATPase subunit